MRPPFLKSTLLLLSVFVSSLMFCQDVVYLNNGDELTAQIRLIGKNFIECMMRDSAVQKISLTQIKAVKFNSTGEVIVFDDRKSRAEEETIAIKVQPLGLINHHLTFCFEKHLARNKNFEGKIGIIYGPAMSSMYRDQSGFFVKPSIKFLLLKKMKRKNISYSALTGKYLKLELTWNHLRLRDVSTYYPVNETGPYGSYTAYKEKKQNVTLNSCAFHVIRGRQIKIFNTLLFDYYYGLGVNKTVFSPNKSANLYLPTSLALHSHTAFATGFSVTAGIAVGLPF